MSDAKMKHPDGLMTLFFSEMWERFCYYGMRVLLTLYLVKSLMKGDAEASLIYGAYTGLVYAAPILGGKMADRFLGYRLAVMFGAVLMALGEFLILGGNETFLLIGMGVLIVGNGYFKANISTIVGKLYEDGDPRRDSGFTIFYIGINVGALLATTVVAYVGETYGFDKGFGLAGIGMLTGLIIFWSGRNTYAAAQGLDVTEEGKQKTAGLSNATLVMLGSLLVIPLCYYLIENNGILDYIFLGLFIFVAYSLVKAGIDEDKKEGVKIWKDRMIALIIFMVINIVFWACFEQAGTSLTLFADRNVDREIFGWVMPASMTQFFNPFFIIVFGSLFSIMWVKLSAIGKNPNIPLKFSIGILQLGLGFLVTYIGYQLSENSLVPLLTLVFLYMLHTTGELFLSPIGLSMVTKLSPKNMAATAMGAWFLSFAIANFLGGKIAAMTGSGHGGPKVEQTGLHGDLTVEDGLAELNRSEEFATWEALATDVSKDDDQPVNSSYGTWLAVQDWVILRESINNGKSYADWKALRGSADSLSTTDQWLDKGRWAQLGERYVAIVTADNKLKEDEATKDQAGISLGDWGYFKGGIEELETSESDLELVLAEQKAKVQSNALDNYVNIFTIIGLVLLGFSLLIAITNKPLNKLMHGVE
jgi:POT family proton-dependent oligopeptide transporter